MFWYRLISFDRNIHHSVSFRNCSKIVQIVFFVNFRFFRFSFNFRRFIQYRGEKRGKLLKRGNSIFRRENVQSDSRNKQPVLFSGTRKFCIFLRRV